MDDYRIALLNAGYLFIPAAIVAFLLPQEKDQDDQVNQPAD
ncbi:hypothetical protein [Verrucomicrobium spinosum]|nr:hypothetical protein [Verrucomicrobium spinosum]